MEQVQHRGLNESFPGNIRHVFCGQPLAAASAQIMADTVIANGAQVIANQPDVPRNITFTVTDANASITAGLTVVVGQDAAGNTITDTLDHSLLVLTKTTTNIYAKITSITTSGLTGNGGTDKLKIGTGNVIGFGFPVYATTAVKHVYLGGVRQASPTIVAGDGKSGVDASTGTYDGAKALLVIVNSEG